MENSIRNNIKKIQDKLKELRSNNVSDSFELETYFIQNMTDIYDMYPSLIKRLCREENQDNTYLFKMLDEIDKINSGEKNINEVEHSLGQELAEKFIYSKVSKN